MTTRPALQRIQAAVTLVMLQSRLVVITRVIASSHLRLPELRRLTDTMLVTECTTLVTDLLPPTRHPCQDTRDRLSVVVPDMIRLSNL